MSEFKDKIAQLETRLKHLENYEAAFKREIADIKREINLIDTKSTLNTTKLEQSSYTKPIAKKPLTQNEFKRKHIPPKTEYQEPRPKEKEPVNIPFNNPQPISLSDQAQSNLEKFIGENLISKIGIVVLIIGVGIGAKYAIDNNLISPLMRILFGYAVGLGLIGFAVKLKAKYHDYSAVLMSGGMAIMYFITYFAYSYYSLLSQISAFSLMLIFTVFTVLVSIIYNRQIIAHIGLVGAYATPFLLSEDSGNYAVLFIYISIINIGILAVSVKNYWKPLFFNAFIFTWLIYCGWNLNKYINTLHFNLALTFLSVFFAIFYLTFIAYKVVKNEEFRIENILLILVNSLIFFSFGYSILNTEVWTNYLGLFTLFNAIIHFAFGVLIHQFKFKDKTAFYLIVALVLTFVSITIPIQFDGHWITIIWMAEALFLFIIGRMKKIPLFEYFSYPILALTGLSLLYQWQLAAMLNPTELSKTIYPFVNGNFLTTLFVTCGLGIIYLVDRNEDHESALEVSTHQIVIYLIPPAFLVVLYNLFRIEIGNYYQYLELKTAIPAVSEFVEDSDIIVNSSLQLFNVIWQLNYSMLFLTILSFVNIKKLRSTTLGVANLILNSLTLAVFMIVGLVIFSNLSFKYLNPLETANFEPSIYYILIRYISYIFVAGLVLTCYKYIKQGFITKISQAKDLLIAFDLGFYFLLLVIFSSELINWSDIIGIKEIFRLGLSILFGIYAVTLIFIGIVQKKQHLRVFAIVLFAITLMKLFFYDIAELGTISKTIVFVSVGTLLLIASFLYTKYKGLMFEDEII